MYVFCSLTILFESKSMKYWEDLNNISRFHAIWFRLHWKKKGGECHHLSMKWLFSRSICKIDCINQIYSVVVTRKMQEKTKNIYVNSPWHLHQQTKCFNFTDLHYNTNAHFRENAELRNTASNKRGDGASKLQVVLKTIVLCPE